MLTPDIYGEGKEQKDFSILVKGFKPSSDKGMVYSLEEEILNEIQEMKDIGAKLHILK